MNAMKINLSQIKKRLGATETVEFVEEIKGDFLPKQVRLNGPVKVKATATNTGDSILVKGKLEVPVTMQCNRCLADFGTEFSAKFEEEYYPVLDETEGNPILEKDFATYQNNLIELTPLVEETILLSIPMKPLCQDACQGLCSRCGQDLNIAKCDCVHDNVDIRLEGLKKLLQDKD